MTPEEQDIYEQGYQEGVMDTEEELIGAFKASTGVSITNETRLGYTVATITLQTTSDSRVYELLMRYAKSRIPKTTESVVSQGSNVSNPLSRALPTTIIAPNDPEMDQFESDMAEIREQFGIKAAQVVNVATVGLGNTMAPIRYELDEVAKMARWQKATASPKNP
jgi:hypothetical protein